MMRRVPTLVFPLLCVAAVLGVPVRAAPGDQPVKPLLPNATSQPSEIESRTTSLPARGLFDGERLSEQAKDRLAELIVEAEGLNVEIALLVPSGPWKLDGKAGDERSLTDKRLQALRGFLTDRGIDPKRIYVESRIDDTLKEPRLDVQLMGKPAQD